MKNLTKGQKMVWTAVFAVELTKKYGTIVYAIIQAEDALQKLKRSLQKTQSAIDEDYIPLSALETAKEVLK